MSMSQGALPGADFVLPAVRRDPLVEGKGLAILASRAQCLGHRLLSTNMVRTIGQKLSQLWNRLGISIRSHKLLPIHQ